MTVAFVRATVTFRDGTATDMVVYPTAPAVTWGKDDRLADAVREAIAAALTGAPS